MVVVPCGSAGTDDLCAKADSSCSGQPIHLWQFLRELLLKPHNYRRSIRWINKEKGENLLTTSPLHLLHLHLLLHTLRLDPLIGEPLKNA